MYGDAFTSYAKLSEKFLFRYADRALHTAVLDALDLRAGEVVLEIGCDQGKFLQQLRPRCARAMGIDVNAAAVRAAADPDIRRGSATALDFPAGSIDKIVALHTLEHVDDLEKAFNEIGRVLRQGGRAVIAYPLELVRGFSTLPSALFSHHDPFMARRMHVRRLLPSSLPPFLKQSGLDLASSRLLWWPNLLVPVYVSVLDRR